MIRSKYSRRIRKKKKLGEFTETGFLIYLYCGEDKDFSVIDSFIDLIVKKKMYCSGGGDPKKYSFLVERQRKEITPEEREFVIEEARKIQGVNDVLALDLVNLWYSDSDEYFEKAEEKIKEHEEKRGI
jgi:uncharacterized protein YggL (DUF469 family)